MATKKGKKENKDYYHYSDAREERVRMSERARYNVNWNQLAIAHIVQRVSEIVCCKLIYTSFGWMVDRAGEYCTRTHTHTQAQ